MASNKNYYSILELSDEDKKLSNDEFTKKLKGNFRRLSLKYHPDKNPGDKEAEEKFKEVSEAYAVLGDKDKRAQYDNAQMGGMNFDFSSMGGGFASAMYDDLFASFGFANPFTSRRGQQMHQPKVVKGQDLRIRIPITLLDIMNGGEKKIKYKHTVVCDECHGDGLGKESKMETCPHCNGTGFTITSPTPQIQMRQICQTCHGTGKVPSQPCAKCGGSGVIEEESIATIPLEKGGNASGEYIIKGGGNAPAFTGQKNQIMGDLFVYLSEVEHDTFKRDGANLHMKVDVPVLDALAGGKVKVTLLDEKELSVTVNPCAEDGDVLRVANYGLPVMGNPSERGSLFCHVHVTMPKSLSEGDKKEIEKLRELTSFKR